MLSKEQESTAKNEQREIPKILTFFGFGFASSVTLLTGGDANHNYLVTTQDGPQYVVKFPIEESRESLENDRAIEEQLVRAGIGSSIYCRAADGQFIYDEGITAVISPKIEGMHPETIDKQVSFAIGKVLADYHEAVTILPYPHNGWLNQQIVARPNTREEHPFTQQARRFIEEGKIIFEQDLPRGIIHGDLHEGNLLVDPEDKTKITAIFDFEEAEKNLYIVDITRTMLAICTSHAGTSLDRNLMEAFQAGYSSVRPLESKEVEGLPIALKYAAGACILWYMNNGYETSAKNVISRVQTLAE